MPGRRESMHSAFRVILLIAPSRAFDRGLLRGISRYSNEKGPWTFYREPPHYRNIDWDRKVSDRLRSGNVDAIIMREPERIDEIIETGVPGICAPVSRHTVDGFVNITIDNRAVGQMAADHLMNCRFRHFAFCGFEGVYWSARRGRAFCRRIRESGYNCHIYEPEKGIDSLWEKEAPVMIEWLKSLPKPVGIMTCNDDRAQHVLDACHAAKIHMPAEVGIIGVDNDEFVCELGNPPLTSICLNPERLGYQAARVLAKVMSGRDPLRKTIVGGPTHVVPRRSTDILLLEDAEIADAIRFIRDNCDQPLRVDDVADAVAMSRRTLQQRFAGVVGMSVHKQILTERVARITQLLVETDLTVAQIAEKLNFSSPKQLDRVFIRLKEVAPTVYRSRYRAK